MSKKDMQTIINCHKNKPFVMTYRFPAECNDYNVRSITVDIVDITVAIQSGFKYLWIDRQPSNVYTDVLTSFYNRNNTLNKVFTDLYMSRHDKKLPLL